MRENVLEHVVTTPLPVRMPLQATGQSEKLIVQPCWRAILAQQPLMAAAVSPPGCAILTHRLCYRALITTWIERFWRDYHGESSRNRPVNTRESVL